MRFLRGIGRRHVVRVGLASISRRLSRISLIHNLLVRSRQPPPLVRPSSAVARVIAFAIQIKCKLQIYVFRSEYSMQLVPQIWLMAIRQRKSHHPDSAVLLLFSFAEPKEIRDKEKYQSLRLMNWFVVNCLTILLWKVKVFTQQKRMVRSTLIDKVY